MSCCMELVWELEKVDVEKALLTMRDPVNPTAGVSKCLDELSDEVRPYFYKRFREQVMELMEEEVEDGKINEGQYLDGANRLARLRIGAN